MPSNPDEKSPQDLPPPAKRAKTLSQQFAMALELPFVLVGAVAVGGVMGFFLDKWLHTRPVFLLILGGLGFAAGIRDVLRRLPKD